MLLKEIQNLEYQLLNTPNCGSDSVLFTEMMYKTNEWVDKEYNAKHVHISPYKVELDKQVDMIAYYIECGNQVNRAIYMIGKVPSKFRKSFTDTHKAIINAARKQRKINQLKNK